MVDHRSSSSAAAGDDRRRLSRTAGPQRNFLTPEQEGLSMAGFQINVNGRAPIPSSC